jgi:hypothetical protein
LRFDLDRPDSLNDVLRRLTDLGKGRKVIENSIMRDMSHSAAQRLVPVVQAGIRSSPAPQAAAVAGTVRSKRDRMIVVRAGATNPKLSGWKRNSRNKLWRGSVAWGVAVGPWARPVSVDGGSVKAHRVSGHSRRGVRVKSYRRGAGSRSGYQRGATNYYRVGRSGNADDPFSGYLSGVRDKVEAQAIEEYADIILEVVRRNGWPIGASSSTRTGV